LSGPGEATLGTEPGKVEKTAPVLRAEKVAYTGLQPSTKYYYDVKGLDDGRGSFTIVTSIHRASRASSSVT